MRIIFWCEDRTYCLIGTGQKQLMAERNGKKWYEKAITHTNTDLQHPVEPNSVTLKMEATSSF
jgi:hypothetical protein